MADKIYCGSAKIITTQYGEMYKGSMHRDDISKVLAWMDENNSEWFNFAILEKRDKIEGKPTHYMQLDEWKPNKPNIEDIQDKVAIPEPDGSDLPF
jgi:hypothetical protein